MKRVFLLLTVLFLILCIVGITLLFAPLVSSEENDFFAEKGGFVTSLSAQGEWHESLFENVKKGPYDIFVSGELGKCLVISVLSNDDLLYQNKLKTVQLGTGNERYCHFLDVELPDSIRSFRVILESEGGEVYESQLAKKTIVKRDSLAGIFMRN